MAAQPTNFTRLNVTDADGLSVASVNLPNEIRAHFQAPTAGGALSQTFFIADDTYEVIAVRAVWATASTSGTMMLERLQGTEAPDAGDDLLTATVDLASTANTVASPALTATTANLQLAAGDRLGLVLGGTLTNLIGLCVDVILKRI